MANYDDTIRSLESSKSCEETLALLTDMLKQIADDYAHHQDRGESLAYIAAGLMSLAPIRKLDPSSKHINALEMAGELELPPWHRSAEVTWDSLLGLISSL